MSPYASLPLADSDSYPFAIISPIGALALFLNSVNDSLGLSNLKGYGTL